MNRREREAGLPTPGDYQRASRAKHLSPPPRQTLGWDSVGWDNLYMKALTKSTDVTKSTNKVYTEHFAVPLSPLAVMTSRLANSSFVSNKGLPEEVPIVTLDSLPLLGEPSLQFVSAPQTDGTQCRDAS